MPKRLIRLEGRPLFDIASYARPGSSLRDRLSSGEIEQITLTVRRAPEVMVKILTRGGQDLKAIRQHLSYLNRGGDLDIETDDGERLKREGVESDLLSDWDLELEEDRRRSKLGPREDRAPPKMVHKILFSMPPGTPPQKVLEAVKNFAREEFALQHRYAMVLHTDEPHPHVHLLLKATSDQGRRLNIRKAMLRQWRSEFAGHLRKLGVPANATERAVRGEARTTLKDEIYRADRRGASTWMTARRWAMNETIRNDDELLEPDRLKLLATRRSVEQGWRTVSGLLRKFGPADLATEVDRFVDRMPIAKTDAGRYIREPKTRSRLTSIHDDRVR